MGALVFDIDREFEFLISRNRIIKYLKIVNLHILFPIEYLNLVSVYPDNIKIVMGKGV
jgi:hypothetical protein